MIGPSLLDDRTNNQKTSSTAELKNSTTAYERYASLIRPPGTISQIKPRQRYQQQSKHRSFFADSVNNKSKDDPLPTKSTHKTSNMKEGNESDCDHANEACTNDDMKPSCKKYSSDECPTTYGSEQETNNKEIATTATVQTTSISTILSDSQSLITEQKNTRPRGPSIVSPSIISTSPPATTMIETDMSNLTESPSSEGSSRVRNANIHKATRFHRGIKTSEEDVLASITRLQELEHKRSVIRHQRFGLEQRLHKFRRVTMAPMTSSKDEACEEEGSHMVTNWKYTIDEHHVDAKRTMLYTGRLNSIGQPNDDNAFIRFGDGQVYKGGVRNGQRHGSGTNQWPNGQTYSGEWYSDSRNGRGTHVWKDGRTVTGTWKDGHLHGKVYCECRFLL